MRIELLDLLRCPYCGGRLELVTSSFHRYAPGAGQDDVLDGILACHCCVFPVIDGIAVMHLEDAAPAAKDHVEAGRPDLARRAMLNLEGEHIARFEEAADSPSSTYRDTLTALGPAYERGYFLYRFSDPSYLVARPFIRGIARTVVEGGRVLDLCGGSGHLTRALMDLSPAAPVLADLYFAKLWLARRFTAPGCEAICCNGNSPLPFARGAFRFAMCADAFMFIWTKRQFVGDMLRLIGDGQRGEAAVITHTHNQLQWSPSLGDPLPPEGYLDLFETVPARLYSEAALFEDVMRGGPLDLARNDSKEALDADPALMVVASRNPEVFAPQPLDEAVGLPGELRINPLYTADESRDGLHLRLAFPDEDYESEFGACRQYLPETLTIPRDLAAALHAGRVPPALADLMRRRVILDLPRRYY
jgi:uncharacterized protein YbaR (Trm112 family)